METIFQPLFARVYINIPEGTFWPMKIHEHMMFPAVHFVQCEWCTSFWSGIRVTKDPLDPQ